MPLFLQVFSAKLFVAKKTVASSLNSGRCAAFEVAEPWWTHADVLILVASKGRGDLQIGKPRGVKMKITHHGNESYAAIEKIFLCNYS